MSVKPSVFLSSPNAPPKEKTIRNSAGVTKGPRKARPKKICVNYHNRLSGTESMCFIDNDGKVSAIHAMPFSTHAHHHHHHNQRESHRTDKSCQALSAKPKGPSSNPQTLSMKSEALPIDGSLSSEKYEAIPYGADRSLLLQNQDPTPAAQQLLLLSVKSKTRRPLMDQKSLLVERKIPLTNRHFDTESRSDRQSLSAKCTISPPTNRRSSSAKTNGLLIDRSSILAGNAASPHQSLPKTTEAKQISLSNGPHYIGPDGDEARACISSSCDSRDDIIYAKTRDPLTDQSLTASNPLSSNQSLGSTNDSQTLSLHVHTHGHDLMDRSSCSTNEGEDQSLHGLDDHVHFLDLSGQSSSSTNEGIKNSLDDHVHCLGLTNEYSSGAGYKTIVYGRDHKTSSYCCYLGDDEDGYSGEDGTERTPTPTSSTDIVVELPNLLEAKFESWMDISKPLQDEIRSDVARMRYKYHHTLKEVEADTIRLRKRAIETRKQAREWMFDYHMEEEVQRLATNGVARVKALVEAYETVMQYSDSDGSQTHGSERCLPT